MGRIGQRVEGKINQYIYLRGNSDNLHVCVNTPGLMIAEHLLSNYQDTYQLQRSQY